MARIEIWKAKPTWQAMPLEDKRTIIRRLTALVKPAQQDSVSVQDESGPFLVQITEGTLLIWTTDWGEVAVAAQYSTIGLNICFEPLVYAVVTEKLNAKMLARKLSA